LSSVATLTAVTSLTNIRIAGLFFGLLVIARAPARAQVVVNVDEDVSFRLGILADFQGDTVDAPGAAQATNFFVRRVRLLFGGQVAKNMTFFVEAGTPNLGKALPEGKNIQPAVIIQDAYGEFGITHSLAVDAGLIVVPFSRNSIQSPSRLMPIDYGPYTFSQNAPIQSTGGRDTGFQAKGYLLDSHLEYRIGVFQGLREPMADNGLRYAGRVQYNIWDTEASFFYPGTYLGTRKVLAVGTAFDRQKDFQAYSADVFVDYPLGRATITGQFDYNRFDEGVTLTTLPKQNDVLLQVGYLIGSTKLMPVLQFARRRLVDAANGDEQRIAVGANYWWAGHNANIKAAYTRVSPAGHVTQHEFTLQLQLFYF
jgi:hypothetical protein